MIEEYKSHLPMLLDGGKAIARMQPDYREGRPQKYRPAQISHALELLSSGKIYRQVEEITGICKSTLVRAG